jgi:hypothetical protein
MLRKLSVKQKVDIMNIPTTIDYLTRTENSSILNFLKNVILINSQIDFLENEPEVNMNT